MKGDESRKLDPFRPVLGSVAAILTLQRAGHGLAKAEQSGQAEQQNMEHRTLHQKRKVKLSRPHRWFRALEAPKQLRGPGQELMLMLMHTARQQLELAHLESGC